MTPPSSALFSEEFTTHPSLDEPVQGRTLTVGIGAWTIKGPSIVLAADTRVTYGTSPVPPHDQAGKQYPLPFGCAVVIAGSITESHEFIARLVQQLENFQKANKSPDRQDMTTAIDEARWMVYRPRLDWAMRADLGMPLADWHKTFMPPANVELYDPKAEYFGCTVIRNNPLRTSCIVGGFVGTFTMFFCAKGMRPIESESNPGIYVIGSGSIHASRKLAKRGQNLSFSLARTVFHVHEAMLAARQEKTVGPPTNYVVMVKDRPIQWIHSECELLKVWRQRYRRGATDDLDSAEANQSIKAELREMRMPPYDEPL